MDSRVLSVDEKDKGNAVKNGYSALDTTHCSNPPDSSASGTNVTEEDGGSRSSEDLETETDSLEQRLPSAELDTGDIGRTRTIFEGTDYNEGQKEGPETASKHKASVMCPTEIGFQNSGCITDSIKDIDQKNMPPSNNEKPDNMEQIAENRQTIEAKTEPTSNQISTQSAVCSERNKQIVTEKVIVQTPSVQSEKEIQPSVTLEGAIKDIYQQNLNESRKNMPHNDEEKEKEVERTAVAPDKEYKGESKKDTAVCSESNKDILTEQDNVQHSDSHKDGPRKRHQVVKLVLDNDKQTASQKDEPIEELRAMSVKEQTFSCEIRENLHTIRKLALFVSGFSLFVLVLFLNCFGTTPSSESTSVMTFLKEFKKLKAEFPGQNEALWLRSGKMLQKHLNKSQPLEPATLILTAAQDGEHTLRCLSIGLARAYATSLNSSWNMIDGPSQAAYDSTTTKLQVDETLSSGFESKCRAAVLHRIEKLAPGSLLILYKYCDHENAVFKNVALVLTVLLKQSTLKSNQTLPEVEEQVKDFLWEKYTSRGSGNSYNEMNVDKMSGVWSRISHLVLPVYPVQFLESGSCPWSELKKTQT